MPPKDQRGSKKGKSKTPKKNPRSKTDAGQVSKTKRRRINVSETSSVIPDTHSQSENSETVEDSEITTTRATESVITDSSQPRTQPSQPNPSSVPSSSRDEVFTAGGCIYRRNSSGIQLFDDMIPSWVSLGPVPSGENSSATNPTQPGSSARANVQPEPATPARAGNSWTNLQVCEVQ